MSDINIRPSVVDFEDRVTIKYTCPLSATGEIEDRARCFTIGEVEDILIHARMHDATDDHYINFDQEWNSRRPYAEVTLPKHWADVSTPPAGRYAPVHILFWYGWRCGFLFAGIMSFFAILLALTN